MVPVSSFACHSAIKGQVSDLLYPRGDGFHEPRGTKSLQWPNHMSCKVLFHNQALIYIYITWMCLYRDCLYVKFCFSFVSLFCFVIITAHLSMLNLYNGLVVFWIWKIPSWVLSYLELQKDMRLALINVLDCHRLKCTWFFFFGGGRGWGME